MKCCQRTRVPLFRAVKAETQSVASNSSVVNLCNLTAKCLPCRIPAFSPGPAKLTQQFGKQSGHSVNAGGGSTLDHHLTENSAAHNARTLKKNKKNKKPFGDQYKNKQHLKLEGETAFKFQCHFSFLQRLGGVQDFNHNIYEM